MRQNPLHTNQGGGEPEGEVCGRAAAASLKRSINPAHGWHVHFVGQAALMRSHPNHAPVCQASKVPAHVVAIAVVTAGAGPVTVPCSAILGAHLYRVPGIQRRLILTLAAALYGLRCVMPLKFQVDTVDIGDSRHSQVAQRALVGVDVDVGWGISID